MGKSDQHTQNTRIYIETHYTKIVSYVTEGPDYFAKLIYEAPC